MYFELGTEVQYFQCQLFHCQTAAVDGILVNCFLDDLKNLLRSWLRQSLFGFSENEHVLLIEFTLALKKKITFQKWKKISQYQIN